jgi:hypothetical protein
MARTKSSAQLGRVITDVERVAKRLRTEVRKRANALPKDLKVQAARLRKQAAAAAALIEDYVHEIRVDLEKGARKAVKRRRKAAKRSRAIA